MAGGNWRRISDGLGELDADGVPARPFWRWARFLRRGEVAIGAAAKAAVCCGRGCEVVHCVLQRRPAMPAGSKSGCGLRGVRPHPDPSHNPDPDPGPDPPVPKGSHTQCVSECRKTSSQRESTVSIIDVDQ